MRRVLHENVNLSTLYDSTAVFQCLPGYHIDGLGNDLQTIRCTETGEWEHVVVCYIKGSFKFESFKVINVS